MANGSKEARYLPALAVLLLLTLGAAAWLLYGLNSKGDVTANANSSLAVLVNAHAASIQAHRALGGDQTAKTALEEALAELNAIQAKGLSESERSGLAQLRAALEQVLEGQSDLLALRTISQELDEISSKFSDAIYTLQGELEIQRQPVIMAHLERLRVLASTLPILLQSLRAGTADADRQMLDIELELQQIVRAMQAGDPALGITPVTQDEIVAAVAGLARRADQLGEAVRSALRLAATLPDTRSATDRLDGLIIELEANVDMGASASADSDLGSPTMLRVYALLAGAIVMVLVLLLLWMRASRYSSKARELAVQSEGDQQAILQLLDELGNLADGDLTVQATVTEDITGAIADSINYAIEAMRDLVTTINEGAILVEDATKQTQVSSHALESASEAQSRQVKAASEAVHNMAASIDEVSGNAERSSDVARHSVDIAHKGGDAVRRTIEGMNTIRETIQDTSKRIKRLGESTQEIGDIVELINDIADQTNVLALNASIQASMAGEAGRGFAVVADEVQRLAERSANATKQIEVLVSTIQSDTNEAVVSMERSTTDVVGGALLAENAGAALEEIEQVSNQIAMLVQNISGSSREQTEAAKTVLNIVERLNQISNETDASASTTANFISKLSDLASQLRESVSGFILPESKSGERAEPAEEESSDSDFEAVDEDDFANNTSRMFVDQDTA